MIQNQVGAGLAPLGNFCNIAGCPVTSGGITQNAQRCQTGTRWFQQLKGISYPKPLKKFIHIFVSR